MKQPFSANDVTRIGLVAALYIVLTIVTAPLSFGFGVRIGEGLNFLALYNKRHIYGITIGVFFVNYFAYGVWDMVVGSLSTFVFLFIGRYLADRLFLILPQSLKDKVPAMLIKYIILGTIFTLSMITIALLVVFLGAPWETLGSLYVSMMLAEALSLLVGGTLLYLISRRMDFK